MLLSPSLWRIFSSKILYHILSSQEGVQQGDPQGPLLLCLAIYPLILACQFQLKIAYMDDITLVVLQQWSLPVSPWWKPKYTIWLGPQWKEMWDYYNRWPHCKNFSPTIYSSHSIIFHTAWTRYEWWSTETIKWPGKSYFHTRPDHFIWCPCFTSSFFQRTSAAA